ncbi:neutral/alkaline non-lysosomal ceramidase N-terminal domain-containing protein [Pigmentibacter sp. JX0631]|uniref:neutral/alkaline non-lysosomal ceramidase N-terminal domain-containing protein n=1 Tax=Pigmentibacter sp. JX0631 TaxID=2976982 RepID=UPI002468E2E8|nr:neutral/alkaline non-lysosomal ceramidase N-terminal domain-containing protein [Pigmentibacter sp. JX0631]WGL60427.1 neutral/alkaline non-lysosomal ceramidase N-terminal domain-containing protein [Pigmentibacter sp. JX0631]
MNSFKLGILIISLYFIVACQIEINKPPFNASNNENSLFFPADSSGGMGSLSSNLQVGMSAKSIYPNFPVSLSGFGSPLRRLIPPDLINIGDSSTFCKPFQNIDHSPRIKVILFKGKNNSQDMYYLLINLDIIAIPSDFNLKMIKELQNNFPSLNLSHANVQFIATHTHSGPAGLTENPFWAAAVCDRFNPKIYELVRAQIFSGLNDAISNLGTIQSYDNANYTASGYNFTRFAGMEVDRSTYYLNLKDVSSNSLACFKVFSGHPTWYGAAELTLSGDFAGYLEESLQNLTHSTNCAFFNSVVGNASINAIDNITDRKTFANTFVNETIANISNNSNLLSLNYGTLFITLPGFQINFTGCGISFGIIPEKYFSDIISIKSTDITNNITKISWFSLGSTYFFLFPGEPLFDTKQLLQSMLATYFPTISSIVVLSTANDYVGYLMTSSNYLVKNMDTCSTIHGPNTSASIIDGFKNSLNQFGL